MTSAEKVAAASRRPRPSAAAGGSQAFLFGAQRFEILSGMAQFVEFGAQALMESGQRLGLQLMAPGQAVVGADPLLQGLQAGRIDVDSCRKGGDLAQRLLDLNPGRIEQLRAGRQFRTGRVQIRGQGSGAVQQGAQIPVVAVFAAQRLQLPAAVEQLFGIGEQAVLPLQGLELSGGGRQPVQFTGLEGEQFAARIASLSVFRQGLETGLAVSPGRTGLGHLGEQCAVAAEGVEQADVGIAAQQRLVLVLAVDVDEQITQFLQLLHGGGAAIDVTARAAVAGEDTTQQALGLRRIILGGEPGRGGVVGADVEAGGNLAALGTGADAADVAAIAQRHAQGIDDQGFAGAGLAGNRGHAALELDFQAGDQTVVGDVDTGKHDGPGVVAVAVL